MSCGFVNERTKHEKHAQEVNKHQYWNSATETDCQVKSCFVPVYGFT